MTDPIKKGDYVKPRPNYSCCSTVCGQECKKKFQKNWLYHLFRTAVVTEVNPDGTFDLKDPMNFNRIWLNIPLEMLEKA